VRQAQGDNLALHHALVEARAGDVLVVEVIGEQPCCRALMGDIIAHAAQLRGIAGLVTNGAVRDWDKLHELSFPVFCAGLNINGPAKALEGERCVEISIGEAMSLHACVLFSHGNF
jgi:4-hydroxy-4-methyl-2-oxoglutarate aldolase